MSYARPSPPRSHPSTQTLDARCPVPIAAVHAAVLPSVSLMPCSKSTFTAEIDLSKLIITDFVTLTCVLGNVLPALLFVLRRFNVLSRRRLGLLDVLTEARMVGQAAFVLA